MQPFGWGWGEVSGDRLARITDAIAFRREDPEGPQVVTLTTETAEALVEIAKAARASLDADGVPDDPIGDGSYRDEMVRQWGEEKVALVDALARLGSGAAEEDA
jgi:hypothetical protein